MSEPIEFTEISEIELRNFFPGEGTDFTPWLTDNIEILGNVIGMDLIDAEREYKIGDFSLDIIAYESETKKVVAIENQFETTDHRHLGQLITYMAGIDAKIVVWIAEKFRKEHISAINHLNQISDKEISFFCIRPRIIKIGESKPSIEFILIAKPDDWDKELKPDRNNRSIIDDEEFINHLNIEGKEFFQELFKYGDQKGLIKNWGTTGFSLNVPINGKNVSIFRGYSNLAKSGQHLVSTCYDIIKKVKEGDKFVEEYVRELIKVEGFYETDDGFKFKIKKNLDDKNWAIFKNAISKIVSQIREDELNSIDY